MRQQDQQINDGGPEVIRSEPVPVSGPGQPGTPPAGDPEGRTGTRYPEGTGDQGPDALDERGSYDSDLATSGPGPWSGDQTAGARTRDEQRGEHRLPEDRAEDAALDDDALDDRSRGDRTADPDGDDRGTGDRGDLADASQTDTSGVRADPHGRHDDAGTPAETAVGSAGDAESTAGDTDSTAGDTDSTAGDTDSTAGDTESTAGDTDSTAGADETRTDPAERPEFHEPAPLPTAFGAATVGGAVAASAMAGSHRDARNEDTVRSGDGPASDRIDGVGDASEQDDSGLRTGEQDRSLGAADAAAGRTEPAEADRRPSGEVAPAVVGTSHPADPDILSAGNPDAASAGDHGPGDAGDDGPGNAGDHGDDDSAAATGRTPDAGTTSGTPPLSGATPDQPIVAILEPDVVQGFRDRWREVQLRFVDDPPGATAEAHRLVEESVDALTAALTEQRAELAGWQRDGATDTEQLRMVVRRHRDFLDRLLGRP